MSIAGMVLIGVVIAAKAFEVAYNHRSRQRAQERDARLSAGMRDK